MGFNKFFVKNWQFTLVIFVAVMVLGINALMNMPRGEDPPFGAPIFSIVVVYPGTNPTDMEKLIADPIEEELYQLSDVKKINTTINDGLIVMLAEFNFGVDVEAKNNDVIREINKIRPDLPEGIVLLDIKKAASSDVVILQSALVSDTASMEVMVDLAESLEKDIERIKDIKWVEIQAAPDKEIHIDLDLDRMASMKLGLNQVIGLIQANNINIPGGDIDLGQKKYNIKTTSEFKTIDDIKSTIVQVTPDGKTVKLGQISEIYYTEETTDHIARHNNHRAIWVNSAMKDKKNIIAVRHELENVLSHFKEKLPKGITLEHAFDQEIGVKHRLSGLGRDFAIAIFLVLLTLLPLGTRASIVVMISIPLSLSIGLFMLDLLGYTLNQLSIVGMVVALGLLVDDSIVVVENIERYMRKGISAKEAAISATNHIMVAIMGCTATLLLAFLPLANLPEGSGDFIRSLPMAVMLTVLASLFVSVTIIPFLSSILLKAHENAAGGEGNFFFNAFKKYVNNPYQKLLQWCMTHKVTTLVLAAVIFGLSLMLVPVLGFSLFPESEKPIVTIDIETEPGSNLTHTDKVVRKVEQKLLSFPEIDHISANAGKGNPRIYYNEFQRQNSSNFGQIIVYLDEKTKVPEIIKFAEKARTELANFPGVRIEVKRFQQGPPITAPVEMRIIGNNLDTLDQLSTKVEKLVKARQGTMYVRNDLKYVKSDIIVDVNKEKAGLYGINGAEIAKTVRLAIAGLDISEISNTEGDEFKMKISLTQNTENALQMFDKVYVTSMSGSLVPLKNIAELSLKPSASIIRHFNKERYALVSCFAQNGVNISQLTDDILNDIATQVPMPDGYRVIAAGERESSQESFGGLGTIIILTVFGLLAILILEFRTFKSTIIVLSVIPMGIIGALVALYVSGESLSFVATVGIIALMGIEIKNSILMVDYTNGLREQGMNLYDAVMDGAETRFLPILLTSMTAIGGLTPLVLENSPLISPLAIVLIGGLISSTLLSRLVTPVLYYLIPPQVK
ncbi:MAG TPA: efflux RND transporter permease subunit [Saprospiraceae bacterium]|nr:efflux RND transporter permease subunit [Saprospiraceae bacterium]